MENDPINQHYATLLGLGTAWKVAKVDLNVLGRRLDIFLEYAADAAICPVCGKLGNVYDQQPERVWRHLDTMQFETLIHAKTPRVKCADHKVKVIELPWASKSSHFTLLFEAFAVRVLQAARTIKDARALLRLSWYQTLEIMQAAVERGLARRDGEEITFVGLDEKSFLKGKGSDAFACVLTDIDNHRVLDLARGRTEKGAKAVIDKALNPFQQYMVCGAAMDMSAPFEKAVRELMPCADIVFDKYHGEAHLSEGVDNTRKDENRWLLARDDKRLVNSKYLWLKGFEQMSDEAIAKRNDLLKCALDTGKAWGLKELFGWFWKSRDRHWAKSNFTFWYEQVKKSGLKHMIKVAETLKSHVYGLLAWFDTRITNALTEGFNTTIQMLKATARGYRNFENFRTVVLFYCGKLDMRPDFVRVGASIG